MKRLPLAVTAALTALVATPLTVGVMGCPTTVPPPPPTCPVTDAPPAPERVVVEDCAAFITLFQRPEPPPCPPSDPPVPSLCPAGGAAPGGVVETQAALEAYAGCTAIDGDLTIGGAVCSLAPLSSVESITGSLTLGGGEGASADVVIVDLDGLGALTTIGRNLTIRGLPALASLNGLNALTGVGFDVELFELPALSLLQGPDSLVEVGGDVSVGFNDDLTVVEGFDGLARVGTDADFRAVAGVRFQHNGELACVGGFSALVEVGEVEFDDAPVQTAPGLSAVLIVRGPTLKLIDTPDFNLLTLPPLEHLDGLVLVRGPTTTDLRAFAGLQTMGDLSIFGCALENLGGLDGLVSLGSLDLQNNAALDDVSALAHVTELGRLHVTGDVGYDLACAFAGVTAIDDVIIARAAFTTLPWPQTLTRIGTLSIVDNENLTDLGDVTLTLGDAVIANNAVLTNGNAIDWLAGQTVTGVAKYGNNAGVPVDPCPWRDDGVCDFFCLQDSDADCPPIED
jgi:hypothetical protein